MRRAGAALVVLLAFASGSAAVDQALAGRPDVDSNAADAEIDSGEIADTATVDAEIAAAEAEIAPEDAERRTLAQALIARGDAGSLATAAMIHHVLEEYSLSSELSRRAAQAAPAPHLVWLELGMCMQEASCDPEPIVQRLSNLDPQNGAPLLSLIPRQTDPPQANSEFGEEIDSFLARLAQAERIDTYWNRLVLTGYDAIQAIDGIKAGVAEAKTYDGRADVTSTLGSAALLEITHLSRICSNEAVADSTRRNLCQRAARALQNGDTILAEALGLALEGRIWKPGTGEHQAVLARRAKLRDIQEDVHRHIDAADWQERWIAMLREHRTEQQASRALAAFYANAAAGPVDANPFAKRVTTMSAVADAPEGLAGVPVTVISSAVNSGESRIMHFQPLEVNLLAVAVAALSAFLLGGLWYSRALFGLVWNRAAGMPPDKAPHGPKVFVTSYVLAFVAAWVFAALLPAGTTLAQAIVLGVVVGAAWVATSFGINYGFGNRSFKLWLIDSGYHTLQFTLYGVILGAWR